MFYISGINANNLYSITDSDDGVTEVLPAEVIQKLYNVGVSIKGVDDNSITPVNYMDEVAKKMDSNVKDVIRLFINTLDIESIYGIARGNGFKREINNIEKEYGIGDEADKRIRECTLNHVYDGQVASIIESCKNYATVIKSVDITNRAEVLSALHNSVCMIVQFGSTKKVTAFVGTQNIALMDSLYGQYAIDVITLHNEYLGYIERMANFKESSPIKYSSDMQKVYSCSLRVRNKGTRVVNREMSSADYTVNIASLIACFALDVNNVYMFRNTYTNMLADLKESKKNVPAGVSNVRYNEDIINLIRTSLSSGELAIHNADELREFMQSHNLSQYIVEANLEQAQEKMSKAFNRIKHERENGGKFLIS